MKRYALIVAGGSGTRMGATVPKQFLNLKGKPILMHTLHAFASARVDEIILVLPEAFLENWHSLCRSHQFIIPHKTVIGGNTRFASVQAGLRLVEDQALVAIHDGVRPVIQGPLIQNGFETALEHGSAIAALPLKDSIRVRTTEGHTESVNRADYFMVQTPQTFQSSLIKKAYDQQYAATFTDDAGVFETLKKEVTLIQGDYKNIKITTPEDLAIAALFLA